MKSVQQRDPDDPDLFVDDPPKNDDKFTEPFDRTNPRHRLLAANGTQSKISSESEPSKFHSIVGNAIESSTCCEAFLKLLMSKLLNSPMLECGRFRPFEDIIGRWLECTHNSDIFLLRFSELSRAVAVSYTHLTLPTTPYV